jgi:hypothetical protein
MQEHGSISRIPNTDPDRIPDAAPDPFHHAGIFTGVTMWIRDRTGSIGRSVELAACRPGGLMALNGRNLIRSGAVCLEAAEVLRVRHLGRP